MSNICYKYTPLLSTPAAAKTLHLSSNSILQLINGISSDLKKLLRYFNGTAIPFYNGTEFYYLD